MKMLVDLEVIGFGIDPMECTAELHERELQSCIKAELEDLFPQRTIVLAQSSICGRTEPEKIVAAAESWNAAVVNELERAVKEAGGIIETGNAVELDSRVTHHLSCCARMADGEFFPEAKFGVLIDNGMGYTKATTFLKESEQHSIRETPENYAVCEVLIH